MSGIMDALIGALGGAAMGMSAESKVSQANTGEGWQNGYTSIADVLKKMYDQKMRTGDGNAVPNSPMPQIPNDTGLYYDPVSGSFPQLSDYGA